MSDLAKRLRASIMYDAINGTAEERAVVARQILEASDYIENFEIGLDAMKEGIGIRIADLESENERLREELGNMNDANAECYHQQAEIERLRVVLVDCMDYVDCDNLTMQTKHRNWERVLRGEPWKTGNVKVEAADAAGED